MATEANGEDDFTHHIAIQLSRALNLVNPNDLLARRVQDIAKTNTVDGFIAGVWYMQSVVGRSTLNVCIYQRRSLSASSKIPSYQNSMQRSCRMRSRRPLEMHPNLCKA